ncbi:NAD(P)/FAD-dependent oxidoreductase [Rummeliibacillus stabekisii]|uniref:NAD(P)/FAD-dependent oxidoreductase n=1 Tax=Rummeliibacillus stabekisii TaxID=241244 RepID=UPI00116AC442|nr:NAD(P)/FAD-dependent oxidoreductase [Rummeliibacillus stabekisii]MBB5171753.1 thioredoxin reductase (NADPH) [Rummeliibacillus stabekisii]GEL06498.1 ferredoxin--NADP reductase 1 [Rummeliibacillus stabekisii]
MDLYDVTIVGGGPAGLYSAFYSGMRDLKTKIIEFHPQLGGKVNIFLEKMLWDVGGQQPIQGEAFLKNLIQQAMTFEPTVCLNSKVKWIEKKDDIFTIMTDSGEVHYSKTVIIAIGGGIFQPIKLEIDGAEKYEMTNLHYTINGMERFRNKELLISGGGNAAIDWACELLPIAKKLTVIYRSNDLKAHESQIKKLKDHGVDILLNTEIQTLNANAQKTAIETVDIKKNGKIQTIMMDDILICHGYNHEVSLDFENKIAPKRNDNQLFESIGQCKTTTPGIFAVGDIVSYDDKVYLLVGTFNDAVLAVNSVKKYIEPEANSYAMVSSHNEKFHEKNQQLLAEIHA